MTSVKTSNGHPISAPRPAPFPPQPASSTNQQSELLPAATQYVTRDSIPNTPLAVSVISASLGGLAMGGLVCAIQPLGRDWTWARPQLGLYALAMGSFHLWEFWTTAGWNPAKLSVDAFLLNNGRQYHYAHAVGLAEYFISSYLLPKKFDSWYCSLPVLSIVVVLLIAAQAMRSLAMIHANKSFSHIVKSHKHDDHTLITHGFFYWAILTQLLLGNIVSAVAFVFVLARFFSSRIKDEEKYLVKFFGQDYIDYRKRVGTCLPFKTT